MRIKLFKTFIALLIGVFFGNLNAQNVCNPNGNLMIYTNYDGGTLNINVDQNIPNLIIGVCGYEATSINLSGSFVSNVIAVRYAGFNGTNNPCGGVVATSINGAPFGAVTTTVFAPSSPLANSNGYGMIICGYSCSNSSNQGGCNTVDQIEAYFLNYFPGSALFAHKVQYNCWSGTHNISNGGSCCPASPFLQGSIAGTQSVCPNVSVTPFTSATAATGGTGAITYQWQSSTTSQSAGFTNISGANAPVYGPGIVSAATYYRRGASTALNPVIYSNVLTVTALSVQPILILPNPNTCEGDVIFLTTFNPANLPLTWSGPANFTSTLAVNTLTLQMANSGTYSVTATYSNGCTYTGTQFINVGITPTVTATGATVCAGESATLVANGPMMIGWDGPNNYSIGGPLAVFPIASVLSSGVYSVTGILGTCFSTATVNLSVKALPVVTLSSGRSVICRNESVTLSAGGAQSYSWLSSSALTVPVLTVTPLATTAYTVEGTAINGCVNRASVTVSIDACTSLNEHLEKNKIVIYPNPNNGNFLVRGTSEIVINIYSETGQLVRSLALNKSRNFEVSVQDLASGIYFLKSESDVVRFNQKIIVQGDR